jgi:hypothetical protein
MPREGAVIVRDLIGKLEVLRVECDKCGRCGMYHLEPFDRTLRYRRQAVRLGAPQYVPSVSRRGDWRRD